MDNPKSKSNYKDQDSIQASDKVGQKSATETTADETRDAHSKQKDQARKSSSGYLESVETPASRLEGNNGTTALAKPIERSPTPPGQQKLIAPGKSLPTAEQNPQGKKEKPPDEAKIITSEDLQQLKQFSAWLRQNFDTLDSDKDGVLTQNEIAQRIADPKTGNNDDAANLAVLYDRFDLMAYTFEAKERNSLPYAMNSLEQKPFQLTKAGLAKFETFANDPNYLSKHERSLAVSELDKSIRHLDLNRDEYLNAEEVAQALKRNDITPKQKQALEDLAKHMEYMRTKTYKQELPGGEVSDDDPNGVIAYDTREHMSRLNKQKLITFAPLEAKILSVLSKSLIHTNNRLAEAIQNDNGNRIVQGNSDSCSYLAHAISMQNLNLEAIDKMVKDNHDKTFTVTFPGDFKNPVTVNAPTKAELAGWAYGTKAAALEKALGTYLNKFPTEERKEELSRKNNKLNSPVLSDRIGPTAVAYAIKLLTGRECKDLHLEEKSESEIRDFLSDANKRGIPLTVSTTSYPQNSGLVVSHAYSVRYDIPSKQVVIENTYKPDKGNDDATNGPFEPHYLSGVPLDAKNDGIFRMTVSEFQKSFAYLFYPDM